MQNPGSFRANLPITDRIQLLLEHRMEVVDQ
jgi:hypothetical protein